MRFYLSSYKFGNFCSELPKLAGAVKVAVIMNAVDWGNPARVAQNLEKQILELSALGFQAEGLDLRNYFGKHEELKEKMSEYGMVWVYGGNAFI